MCIAAPPATMEGNRRYKRYLEQPRAIPSRSRARYELGEQNAQHGLEEEENAEAIDALEGGEAQEAAQDNEHVHHDGIPAPPDVIPVAAEREQHSSSISGSTDSGNRDRLSASPNEEIESASSASDSDRVFNNDEQYVFEEELELENEEIVDEPEDGHISSSSDEIGVRRDLQENNNGNAADVNRHLNNHDNQIPVAAELEQHSLSSHTSVGGSSDSGNRDEDIESASSASDTESEDRDHMHRVLNNNVRNLIEEELEYEEIEDEVEEEDIFSSADEEESDQENVDFEDVGAEENNRQPNNEENENGDENHAARPNQPFQKLLHKIQNDFRGVINEPVLVSRNEMLMMALGLSIKDNQNHSQFLHMITLINSLFGESVLPHSLYLLDQILNSDCGIHYHFYCPECWYYFGEVDHKVVRHVVCETEGCNTTTQIHDLTAAPFFITFDIAIQIEYLLKENAVFSKLKKPVEILHGRDPDSYSDIYDGASYKKFSRFSVSVVADKILSFIFSTDGSPCWKSSKNSIWPLQLTINELPPLIRMNNIIIGGLWFGKTKPPMDLFLIPFMKEIKVLSVEGMHINLRNNIVCLIKAFIILCCVDSGARGPVQGLKSHSGYGSCNWCTHPGEWLDAVRFPVLPYVPQRRTHEGLKAQAEEYLETGIVVDGVQGLSPLFGAPQMDVVGGMSVEYMHLVDLGVTRQFLYAWLNDSEDDWYIGSDAEVEIINGKLASLSPPIEVRRRPRTLKEKKFWNARELENWLLLYSVPVLTGILDNKYLNHWKLFVQAVYLLLQTKSTAEDSRKAYVLLSHFIVKTEQLYGKSMMTFNVHVLIHLPEHLLRWGPLQFSSAYCFEAGNAVLKRLIHSQRGIPQQIKRALSHRLALQILQSECSTLRTDAFFEKLKKKPLVRCYSVNDCHYIGVSKLFTPTQEERFLFEEAGYDYREYVQYSKVIKEKIVYNISRARSRKTDNKFVMLKDPRLLEIVKIVFSQASSLGFVLCREINCSSFCRFPINVSDTCHFMRQVNFIGNDLRLISVDDLSCVCFMSSPVGNYITPMCNVLNVW